MPPKLNCCAFIPDAQSIIEMRGKKQKKRKPEKKRIDRNVISVLVDPDTKTEVKYEKF